MKINKVDKDHRQMTMKCLTRNVPTLPTTPKCGDPNLLLANDTGVLACQRCLTNTSQKSSLLCFLSTFLNFPVYTTNVFEYRKGVSLSDDAGWTVCSWPTCLVLFTPVNGHVYTVAKAVSERSLIKHSYQYCDKAQVSLAWTMYCLGITYSLLSVV